MVNSESKRKRCAAGMKCCRAAGIEKGCCGKGPGKKRGEQCCRAAVQRPVGRKSTKGSTKTKDSSPPARPGRTGLTRGAEDAEEEWGKISGASVRGRFSGSPPLKGNPAFSVSTDGSRLMTHGVIPLRPRAASSMCGRRSSRSGPAPPRAAIDKRDSRGDAPSTGDRAGNRRC
jgi:hypothetical protein